jgi:NADPH2:quinone reductase
MAIEGQKVIVHQHGGPEVLALEEARFEAPEGHNVLIEHTAIGLNFIDTYFRSGLYPPPGGLPFTPGSEGAGRVIAVGPDVQHLQKGDRVAYVGAPGSYSTHRHMPEDRLVSIPNSISDENAAAMMLKGMTAYYLLCETYKVNADTTLLFHAAAGGVGLIAGQWAASLGATVIGTASTQEKIALAKAHGYAHMINYRETDFVKAIEDLTEGHKCDVVYDGVGQSTFEGSLACLKPRGLMVSFGNASGAVPPFDIGILSRTGSLYLTRPTLFDYVATRAMLERSANALFEQIKKGSVTVDISQRYALKDVQKAHDEMEGRKTTGSSVLLP